ncbi:hypothetical protein HKBW3S43_01270 [Candidatus Hakubella thermalkaliphila]|uniref:Uncharacterized protein n=1 Tax=Candidatus Hakubella thermalkaliphila TaxID=2754717 RepID=A0A6V8P5M1_9ACTN|nr:hypothetical protein [Candidatus Hakubella thermalkaliphila]GFP27623.1 hypothetical protein HKBW3S33_01034 [Candidatus Hakubella thermalkaliphila]GFP35479.1 hypothetical protein HKBW3S43_01270 [Candidatus Hakubella thermalkaliphila]
MSFSDLLRPRPEVLSDEGIDGIIDLANLGDPKGRKLEANPERFFSLTYPTADVRRVVQKLSDRFSGSQDAPGLFLFEGLKGSGKSHLLLLVYHLFENPEEGKQWLDAHTMLCGLPEDAVVVVNKFTDLPLYSIWDFVFEQLTSRRPRKTVVQPGLEEMDKVIKDRRLILILDELEQGIRVIGDSAVRAQNIAFLQMLSEWANRSDKVTVFASIYSDQEEPGSTLKRVPSCRVQFAHSADRAKVVLHRLFENYLEFSLDACAPTVDSYLNMWRRQSIPSSDEYRSKMLLTYPFLPEMLELILERVPARGGFQSVRGALGFLANMVRLSHGKVHLITAAHADIHDREVATRLSDLDPSGDLISRARGNLAELKDQPLASEIGASVMLYTLTSTGRSRGATREELIRHVLAPKIDINDFEKTLLAFQKYASHFHVQEGRYFFDLEENADAKVEFRSLTIPKEKAQELLHALWRDEIFREPNAIVYLGQEQTKEALEELDKNRLRYVLAPRRLSQEERHELYHGIPMRNQVILLEPRDPKFNLDTHRDLLKWAQRQVAAQELAGTTRDSGRRADYERIAREDKGHCIDAIKRAGLLFIRWERYGTKAWEDQVEEETIAGNSREDVNRHLSQQLFPIQLFEEHLSSRLSDILNLSIKDIDKQYRSTPGFPVPTTVRSVSQALRELCRAGQIGIRHPRGDFCKENPNLTETELFDATIGEPFETTTVHPPIPTPTEEEGQIAPPLGEEEETIGPVPPPTIPAKKQEISIPPQTGAGQLRQTVAVRLQEFPDAKMVRLRATIFLENSTGDLSSLPASIRGNLSGEGTLTVEITVTKVGEFSKVEVEQIIESLPSLPNADYGARLELLIPSTEEERRDE